VSASEVPPPSAGRPGQPGGLPVEPSRLERFRAGRLWRWGRWPLGAVVFVAGCGIIFLAFLFTTVDLPADPPQLASTVIEDRSGAELAVLSADGLRVPVSVAEMSPMVPRALLASEDRAFYEHKGVNPAGIARALWRNLHSDGTQGGSTITQQLVKNEFLTSERSWSRKLRESVLAVKLERRSDKDEILARYLNTVYFGRGVYGIEPAARIYFDRSAHDLTPAQSAFLIGLLSGPTAAEPTVHPETALRRRNAVLDAMAATGALTPAEAAAAAAEPIGASSAIRPVTLTAGVAPHFVEWIRSQLIETYGEATVYGGGLRVRTTLDVADQRAAETSVAATLDAPDDPQAALVGVDRGGAVRAYVGGRDPAYKVDLARGVAGGGSGRQAGSTFKPFVLAAALEKGVPLERRWDAPARITLPSPEGDWEVRNFESEAFDSLTTTEATAHSANTVYAQMLETVGPAATVGAAHRAGVTSPLGENRSVVFGVDSVSPLEMAAAYLSFARDGSHVDPYAIAEVRDRFDVLSSHQDAARPAFDAPVAQGVNEALRAVVDHGTGTAARLDRPVAGKTGTTDDNGDAWFAGYTPEYAAVVWMGYPEGSSHRMDRVHGRAVTGGSFPTEIWHRFAREALDDVPPTPFVDPPEDVRRGRPVTATLVAARATVAPGEPVDVTGSGYADCFADFHVELLGPRGVTVAAPPELRSSAADRRATVTVPAAGPEGPWRAVASCDPDGRGGQPRAEVALTVDDGRPDVTTTTTTTTAPATTTTTAHPATTTTAPAPTTTRSSPATTTTAPPR
jgi:penicillin-binding protein 1A